MQSYCSFQNLNWDKLANKEIVAPFKPSIKNELDVSNFSDEFTTMTAADSPAVAPVHSDKIFKVSTTVWDSRIHALQASVV